MLLTYVGFWRLADLYHSTLCIGHTLAPVLNSYTQQTGITPERIYVDKGYQGHDYEHKYRVFKSGQKRGVKGTIKKELKRRSVVEPIIGHLKSDHALGRNFLKGIDGDKINALLAGIATTSVCYSGGCDFFVSIL